MKDVFRADAGLDLTELMTQLGHFAGRISNQPDVVPIAPSISPGVIRGRLSAEPPQHGQPLDKVLAWFGTEIEPAINPWNHPGFLAYFGISTPPAALAGAFLAALYNSNAMMWRTSPAGTELTQVTADWLRQMIGLPSEFSGLFFDSASVGVLHAVVAARELATNMGTRQQGSAAGPVLRAYVSTETHFSVIKAAIAAGIGIDNIIKIPADAWFRMDVGALELAIEEDRRAGFLPFLVVGTIGTTSTTSIDPIARLAKVAARYKIWLHVDASYGGMVAAVPEYRHVLDGCRQANSITVNPHKHGFVPLGSSVLYLRDLDQLSRIFTQRGSYTPSGEGEVFNLMDFTFGTGQPIRALPFWFVIMNYGTEGFVARIREHMRLGQLFRTWIEQNPYFELLAPVPFSTIVFRARPHGLTSETELQALNESLLQALNGRHQYAVSSTRVSGRFGLRLTIGNYLTDEQVLSGAWKCLRSELDRLMNVSETLNLQPYPEWSYWARRSRRRAA